MLLPRFSLRTTMFLVTGSALLFLVAGFAVRGNPWAIGATAAVASVGAAMIFYALVYLLCGIFSQIVGAEAVVAKTSRGAVVRDAADQSPHGPATRASTGEETS